MNKTSSAAVAHDAPANLSLISEIRRTLAIYTASRERKRLLMLAGGIFIVIAATAHMQVRLNAWNQPFYDALTRKDLPQFIQQLGVFAVLAAILLTLNVAQVWLNQTTKLTLRRSLVHDMVDQWLKPLRAFRLSTAGSIGANPDQRMSADAQHLADLATDLLIGLLQSTLLLLSFIGVLWFLSEEMFLPWRGRHIQMPGYLVWCALVYAAAASFLSWRVGRPLIALNAERYAREADLRFALVRVNEDIEGITIYGGEAGEKQLLDRVFESVLEVTRRIVGAATRLTWVTSGYGWFTIVAPILVASPSYLSGRMTFGQLMVAVGAFNQVQSCLRWFVDNFSILADWRATRQRVASFQRAVAAMDGHRLDVLDLNAERRAPVKGADMPDFDRWVERRVEEKLGQALETCLREALSKLDEMRRAEGKHLVAELRERLARIAVQVEQVRELAASLRPAFARRLESRLKDLLGGTSIDQGRLAQEAALLAERSDISEELDRLRSHLQQFTKLLDGAGELGKKLDFLLQEMHREANTMLSKTPGVESEALVITGLALEIKAEIEKLREQVQNIE